jgi:hypothetical protein
MLEHFRAKWLPLPAKKMPPIESSDNVRDLAESELSPKSSEFSEQLRNVGSIPLFNPDGLLSLENFQGYKTADPFPHLVLDGLFNPDALHAVLREWPVDKNDGRLESHDDGTFTKQKIGTTWQTPFGPHTRDYFNILAGPAFLKLLEKVTGMWGLIPDPYMFGGGLHATSAGGKLAIHADYNKHPFFKLDRRLNLLIYLNENWTEKNGGKLELWDRDMRKCVQSVLPVFNRTVIFSTTSTSFHGQPKPIVGPQGLWRKSIALYYFSNGRADEGFSPDTADEHSTLWQERPEHGF